LTFYVTRYTCREVSSRQKIVKAYRKNCLHAILTVTKRIVTRRSQQHLRIFRELAECSSIDVEIGLLVTVQQQLCKLHLSLSSHLAALGLHLSFSRPPTSSSLKITNRSFRYSAPYLWNQLLESFREPHPSLNLCFTVSLPWSCQITVFISVATVTVYHPFSLSIPTQNTPFPQIISTLVFQSWIIPGRTSRLPGPLSGFSG